MAKVQVRDKETRKLINLVEASNVLSKHEAVKDIKHVISNMYCLSYYHKATPDNIKYCNININTP